MQSSSDDTNEVFIGNDESDIDEDISSEDEILSTGKKSKIGRFKCYTVRIGQRCR